VPLATEAPGDVGREDADPGRASSRSGGWQPWPRPKQSSSSCGWAWRPASSPASPGGDTTPEEAAGSAYFWPSSLPGSVLGLWGAVDFHQAGRYAGSLRFLEELVISGVAAWGLIAIARPSGGWALLALSVVYHGAVYAVTGPRVVSDGVLKEVEHHQRILLRDQDQLEDGRLERRL